MDHYAKTMIDKGLDPDGLFLTRFRYFAGFVDNAPSDLDIIAPSLLIYLFLYPSIGSGQYIGSYSLDVYQNGRVNPFVLVKEKNKFYLDMEGERYLSYLVVGRE